MKYLEPTMTIKTFAREKVVTVSGYMQGLVEFQQANEDARLGTVSLNTLLTFNGIS